MKINLNQIYKGLDEWRAERKITAESQRAGYLVNVMEEFGELSQALRGLDIESVCKTAEHEIIDALCDIAIFTINAGVDIHHTHKNNIIDTSKVGFDNTNDLFALLKACGEFACYPNGWVTFNDILDFCASSCEYYGFNFEIAMLETIKEISSRTGTYDKAKKKWVKDTSDEAKAKWYSANYELARIKK